MTIYTVSSNAELSEVLSLIETTGGTIQLTDEGSPYQLQAVSMGRAFAPITITAADIDAPPTFDSIIVKNSSNITISDVHIQGNSTKSPTHSVTISNSDSISLINNTMTGTADGFLSESNDAITGNTALLIRNSSDIDVSGNSISHFGAGIGILEVDGLQIADNEISYLQGDGIRGGGIQNADITGNYFHDFFGSTQTLNHSDMIQLWGTNAETVTSNVLISNNLLDTAGGALSQGIFIRNEEYGDGTDAVNGRFQDITITDNVVHNGAPHGITVADVDGLIISNNTVLKDAAAYVYDADGVISYAVEPRVQVTNSVDIQVVNNLGSEFLGQVDDAQNIALVYDNPSDGLYVGNHIVNLSGAGDADLRDLQIRADSPLYDNVGSSLTSLSAEDAAAWGVTLSSSSVVDNALSVALDASYNDLDPGAVVTWHFEDGTVFEGLDVQHTFDTPGWHTVKLVITEADGTSAEVSRSIEISDPYLFAFDFADGIADLTTRDVDFEVNGAESALVDTSQDQGFHLTAGTGLSLTRDNLQTFGLSEFEIDLRFRQDNAAGTGGLIGIHTVYRLDILDDGSLSFWLVTDEGRFTVTTEAGLLSDTQFHDIQVVYSNQDGTLSLNVDDQTVGSIDASGSISEPLSFNVQLGRPFGENAQGVFESVSMNLPFEQNVASTPSAAKSASVFVQDEVLQAVSYLQADAEDVATQEAESKGTPEEYSPEPIVELTDLFDSDVEYSQSVEISPSPVQNTPQFLSFAELFSGSLNFANLDLNKTSSEILELSGMDQNSPADPSEEVGIHILATADEWLTS